MADVLRSILARVKTDHGMHVVHRGEELPDDVAEGERERLEESGAIGEPFKTPDVVADEQAAAEREQFEADVEAQAGASEETKPSPVAPTADSSDEDIDAFIADATAEQVVDAAGDDDALAARLVDAEHSVRGDKARKKVLALTES